MSRVVKPKVVIDNRVLKALERLHVTGKAESSKRICTWCRFPFSGASFTSGRNLFCSVRCTALWLSAGGGQVITGDVEGDS